MTRRFLLPSIVFQLAMREVRVNGAYALHSFQCKVAMLDVGGGINYGSFYQWTRK